MLFSRIGTEGAAHAHPGLRRSMLPSMVPPIIGPFNTPSPDRELAVLPGEFRTRAWKETPF